MAAGNILLQANDGKIADIRLEEGASSNVLVVFPKEGGTLASEEFVGSATKISIATSRMLAGDVTVTNEIVTQGMNTTLYTGNGSTQSVVTGIDMATQWGNDTSEMFGGLVWGKCRSVAHSNHFFDTIRGANLTVLSDSTGAQFTRANSLSTFNNNGFSLNSAVELNQNLSTFASWNFQTTHRTSGTTNHGKAYTCHYNPFTGFTMIKYEGSGLTGHEIPHHLGRKLGIWHIKGLTGTAYNWQTHTDGFSLRGYLNLTNAMSDVVQSTTTDTSTIVSSTVEINTSTNQYILYGWANSYYDDLGSLKGNYEVGTYVGTGATGNKVTTKGKPAWVIIKSLSGTGSWHIMDASRSSFDAYLDANTSAVEGASDWIDVQTDGFTWKITGSEQNALGGTYLYMVAYDTNANGGGTYYLRTQDSSMLQVTDAQIMYSDGYANGTAKNSSEILTGATYLEITYSQGYNYIKKAKDGSFSATVYEPKFGEVSVTSDYYIEGKWYSSVGTPLGNITYLPIKVLADTGGQIVSSESWKYPEIVSDSIVVRDLKVTGGLIVTGGFELGQTWKNVVRNFGVTYTNSTGKPIVFTCSINNSTAVITTVTVAGVQIMRITPNATGYMIPVCFVVPDGANYVLTGGSNIYDVSELR